MNEQSGFDLTEAFANLSDPLPGEIEHWKSLASGENLIGQESNSALPEKIISQRSHSPGRISRNSISSSPATSPSLSDSNFSQTSTVGTATSSSPFKLDVDAKDKFASSLTETIQVLSSSTLGSSIRRFHPAVDSARISIPTAHIYGKNDPYFSQSLQLVDMCKKDLLHVMVGLRPQGS